MGALIRYQFFEMVIFLAVFSLTGFQSSSNNVFFFFHCALRNVLQNLPEQHKHFFLSCKLTTRYVLILTNTGKLACKMTAVLLKMYLLFTSTTKLCFNLFSTNLLSALFSMDEKVEFRLNKTMR